MLRFLVDFTVPFTNRMGEQDMRMMKLRMKISGCFRTARGARDFALLRSVLSTARKQGWNRIETLMKYAGRIARQTAGMTRPGCLLTGCGQTRRDGH